MHVKEHLQVVSQAAVAGEGLHLQCKIQPICGLLKVTIALMHTDCGSVDRRQSSKAGAKTTEEGQTDEPPLLVLPRKGSLSAQPGTPGRSLLGTSPNADSAPANSGLACTNTNMTSDMMQQTLGRTATGLGPDFLRQTLTRTNTDMGQDFMRQTLGRTNTNMGPDMLRQTLGRTNANMGSGFFGRTLGRTGTGMGSVSFGNTKGRSIVEEFGMTQPAVPPLCIDPLVAALMQKAGTDVPLSQPRSTSPAFVVSLCKTFVLLCAALRSVLCCGALCCAVLCCAVLCCAVLCCAVLRCAALCCAVLCRAVLCCAASAQLPAQPSAHQKLFKVMSASHHSGLKPASAEPR